MAWKAATVEGATYHITGTSREFEMVLSSVTRGTGSLSSSDR